VPSECVGISVIGTIGKALPARRRQRALFCGQTPGGVTSDFRDAGPAMLVVAKAGDCLNNGCSYGGYDTISLKFEEYYWDMQLCIAGEWADLVRNMYHGRLLR